jgi:hypothetical protein
MGAACCCNPKDLAIITPAPRRPPPQGEAADPAPGAAADPEADDGADDSAASYVTPPSLHSLPPAVPCCCEACGDPARWDCLQVTFDGHFLCEPCFQFLNGGRGGCR